MCPDTSNCIVVNNVGINDINSLHLEVFPNPTTNNIELRFQGDELELVLCDIQGKLLCSRKIHNAESISLADYPNGVFFLNLQSNEVKIIRKVIKQ